MSFRSRMRLLLGPVLLASVALSTRATASDPAWLVVQNGTYSALVVSMLDADGRETRLGQAPPDFANTLRISSPFPPQPVRFIVRISGESDVLYRSEAVRLTPGARIRWSLPDNVIDS